MPWRRSAWVVAFGASLLACGIDVAGTMSDDAGGAGVASPDATVDVAAPPHVDATPPADAASEDEGVVINVPDGDLPPIPDDAASDAGDAGHDAADAGDAAPCTETGHACGGLACCGGDQCSANNTCNACSSTVGASCQHESDCCKPTWCGSFGRDAPQCQKCIPQGQFCNADFECCNGHCTMGKGGGPGGPGGGPGRGGGGACN